MLCDDENWMLVSAYVANNLASSGIFQDEIFQVATDGSKNVRRLAHHHSDIQNGNDPYWSSPRANISRDGKYAVFTSNWGSVSRMDVFVLKIPFGNTTGISENEHPDLIFYPNPTRGKIQVKELSKKVKIEFFDVMGEKVFEIFPDKIDFEINLPSSLSPGIYFMKMGETVRKISLVR
jgi:hypothetical protein